MLSRERSAHRTAVALKTIRPVAHAEDDETRNSATFIREAQPQASSITLRS